MGPTLRTAAEAKFRTYVVAALSAKIAGAAWQADLEGDEIADLEGSGIGADGGHISTGFVSED